jgi:transposase
MLHIRTTKTASGATAVQVVCYQARKIIVKQHIGSAHSQKDLLLLKRAASDWIAKATSQSSLFPSHEPSSRILPLDKCQYLGFRYGLLYEVLSKHFTLFKFHLLQNKMLTDLVIARIAEPSSKLQSLDFLDEFMGVKHARCELYRHLPRLSGLQNKVESKVIAIAKKEFHFTFSLVFYDVTTLYFESFEEDELRKPGFSKDNKSRQPQILIGLLVTPEGFPVAYQIFEGNTFEGHTLIPVILKFKRRHKIATLTVVADAAMISADNIAALKKSSLHYVVAARTAKLPLKMIREINARLNQQDGRTVRVQTEDYGELICEFSAKRFAKDKREMDKQIKKAEYLLNDPATIKRVKFIKPDDDNTYVLHTELIDKTTLLLGIKGYYTNLEPDVSDRLIIEHYNNLWHVEQAFRIAKSDLQMRPIYHFKEQAIKAHVLICFMALAVCKYLEIKTGRSIKHIVKALKGVTDGRILNMLTDEEIIMRSKIKKETEQLLLLLNQSLGS